MKLPTFTKRDVKAFLLGALFMIILVTIFEWKDFKRGLMGLPGEARLENVK
jgi:hypothetical protein